MHNIINFTSYSGGLIEIDDLIQYSLNNGLKHVIVTEDSSLLSSMVLDKKAKENNLTPIYGSLVNIKEKGSVVLYAINKVGFSELSNLLSEIPKFKMGEKREIEELDFFEIISKSSSLIALDGFEDSVLENSKKNKDREFYQKFIKAFENKLMFCKNNETSNLNLETINSISKKRNIPVYSTGISKYKQDEDFPAWCSFYLNKGMGRSKNSKKINELNNIYSLNNNNSNLSNTLIFENFVNNFDSYSIKSEVSFPKLYESNSGNPLRDKVKEIWIKKRASMPKDIIKKYEKRIKEELEVVESLDNTFEQYFLFYHSLAKGARGRGFEVTLRGSAGGSLVLHILGLSKADPIAHKLSFERFLFKGIKDFPDIDLDVSDKDGCVSMLRDNFGDFYAEIMKNNRVNKATETSKIALSYYEENEIFSPQELENFRKKIKEFSKYLKKDGEQSRASYLIENNHFWKKEYENNNIFKQIIDDAIKIEGKSTGRSVSPSSTVLSPKPLREQMPVQDGLIELYSETCEDKGLLKIDILSSVMLSRINKVKHKIVSKWDKIDKNTGQKIPLDSYISDNKNVKHLFDYMSAGLTEGVNQIGGDIGKFICKDIKPNNISDLMVVLGLIRMGINEKTKNIPDEYLKYKNGKQNPESVIYSHEDLKPILKETYGSIIFEEQIIEISKKIGGFDSNEANLFRKCITKTKDEDKLNNYFKDLFINGATDMGYDLEISKDIFNMLSQKINQFNFSKNHSANYAMIALSEMYLKYEYPAEFLNVYVDNVKDNSSILKIKEEFSEVGYRIRKPDLSNLYSGGETISNGFNKELTVFLDGCMNEDFINYYDDVLGVLDLPEFIEKAIPFYSSKSAFLISNEELSLLKEDISNIIKIGLFDKTYENMLGNEFQELDKIINIRYNLLSNLDSIINDIIDPEVSVCDFSNKNYFQDCPKEDFDEVKLNCMLKENEFVGFSYISKVEKKDSKKNTRKVNYK